MKIYKRRFKEIDNKTFYHGTDNLFDSFSKKKIKRGKAIFLTDDIRYAQVYGKYVYEVKPISNNIFIYTNKNHINKLSQMVDIILEQEKKKPYGKGMDFYPFTKNKVLDGISNSKWNFLEQPIIIKALKKLKFDGFYSKEGLENNYAYFDPKNLKIIKQVI